MKISLLPLLPNGHALCYNIPHKHNPAGNGARRGRSPLKRSEKEGANTAGEAPIAPAFPEPNQTNGGVPMSFEAISNIAQAEAEAKSLVANAETRAKQLAADAESAGKLAVEAAVQKADAELEELSRQVNEKATAKAEALSRELERDKAGLRAKAETKLDAAAAKVVERIVNS